MDRCVLNIFLLLLHSFLDIVNELLGLKYFVLELLDPSLVKVVHVFISLLCLIPLQLFDLSLVFNDVPLEESHLVVPVLVDILHDFDLSLLLFGFSQLQNLLPCLFEPFLSFQYERFRGYPLFRVNCSLVEVE